MASAVPAAVFEDPVTRLLLWSLLIQAGIIAIAFVLVSLASLSISRPIRVLPDVRFRYVDAATVRLTHVPLEIYEPLPAEPRDGSVARQATAWSHGASSAR